MTQLAYAKGSEPYEKKAIKSSEIDEYVESGLLNRYMRRVDSNLEPGVFLKKQRLLTKIDGIHKPNVGCILIFDEEPQATLDTRCAVKVYRLRTTEQEYKREQLFEMPVTINGDIEKVIIDTILQVKKYGSS